MFGQKIAVSCPNMVNLSAKSTCSIERMAGAEGEPMLQLPQNGEGEQAEGEPGDGDQAEIVPEEKEKKV